MQTAPAHIRPASHDDFAALTQIWYAASLKAHDFIDPQYWSEHRTAMQQQYLPCAENYVAEHNGQACGFISLLDYALAAIFVHPEFQGRGIGHQLLCYAQSKLERLILQVYQRNQASVDFYLAHGFEIKTECVDEYTQEKEFVMEWHRSSSQDLDL